MEAKPHVDAGLPTSSIAIPFALSPSLHRGAEVEAWSRGTGIAGDRGQLETGREPVPDFEAAALLRFTLPRPMAWFFGLHLCGNHAYDAIVPTGCCRAWTDSA